MAAPRTQVAGLVLAAGASRRLGTPKQLLRTEDGETLLTHTVRAAIDAGCDPVVVVVGAHAEAVMAPLRDQLSVAVVQNSNWAQGMSSSVVAGLEPLTDSGCTGVLLLACDQPSVTASHLAALIAMHGRDGGRAVSTYAGVQGIPAVWPRDDWGALRALTGDRGARALLRGDEPSVPLPGGALDLDTAADVAMWRAER